MRPSSRSTTTWPSIDTFDVTFRGFGGSPIRGWLHLPATRTGPLPGVVEFGGYGSGRGLAHERIFWAIAGYAHLMMDTRGQGSSWFIGETPDPDGDGAAAQAGFMTQGILDPATYFYRRVFTDAVRAVETIRDPRGGRRRPGGGRRWQPGRRDQPGRGRARAGPRRGHHGRAVPVRLPAVDDAGRHQSVRRDRPVPEGASRPHGAGDADPRPTSTVPCWPARPRRRRSSRSG